MLDLPSLDDTSIHEDVRSTFFALYEVLRNQTRQLTQLEKKVDYVQGVTRDQIAEAMTALPLKANIKDVNHSMDEVLRLSDEKLLGVHRTIQNLENQLTELNLELSACAGLQAESEELSQQFKTEEQSRHEEMREQQRDIGRLKVETRKLAANVKTAVAVDGDLKSIMSVLDTKVNLSEVVKIERRLSKKQQDEAAKVSEEVTRLCANVAKQVDRVAVKVEDRAVETEKLQAHFVDTVDSRMVGVATVAEVQDMLESAATVAEVQDLLEGVPTVTEVQSILDQAQQEMATFVDEFKTQQKTLEEKLRIYEAQKADVEEVNLALEHKANRADLQACLTDARNLAKELVLKASVEDIMLLLDAKADVEQMGALRQSLEDQVNVVKEDLEVRLRRSEADTNQETERTMRSAQQAWQHSCENLSRQIDDKLDYADFLKSLNDQKHINETLCSEQRLLLEWAETCGHTVKTKYATGAMLQA
eukprot:GEMP01026936.1.p1 GENE.GEMP01026936.1~~GEMP01026936.1.p1  ORF type:complete len:476 (+),score=145.18 GEMP01026936.1:120-1547(+)